jgi:hypothetical protein
MAGRMIRKIIASLLLATIWFGAAGIGWIVSHANLGSCTNAEVTVAGNYCGPTLSFLIPTVAIYCLGLFLIFRAK